MIELRKRYMILKNRAKEVMLNGEMKQYYKLLVELEELNFLIREIKT